MIWDGPEQGLKEVLQAREWRSDFQNLLSEQFKSSIVSFKLEIYLAPSKTAKGFDKYLMRAWRF